MKNPKLYLLRHGDTFFSREQRMGGNPELTQKGEKHAKKVSKLLKKKTFELIYHSPLKRSVQTAHIIHKDYPKAKLIEISELSELSNGDMDALTYSEFEQKFPKLFGERKKDKYHWKFPNGESYETKLLKLKSFLAKIKRQKDNIVIVGHQGVNRILLGEFLGLSKQKIPYLEISHEAIYEINLRDTKDIHYLEEGRRLKGMPK